MLSGNNFSFQQDDNGLRQTVAFLRLHVPEFVEPENWPPNRPGLNPVDYSIWGALQQLVYYRRHIRDVEYLKSPANLLGVDWSRRYQSRYRTVSQTIVAHCCNRWRTH